MGKLHEILAVETDLKATAEKITKEATNTFNSKATHFEALHVKFDADAEDARPEAPEIKPMVDKVRDKLLYATKAVTKYFDSVIQKESANQKAMADLVVEGETLLTGVPATVLLGLEAKLKEIRQMYEAIPTIAPGDDWEMDTTAGKGVRKAVSERVREKKMEDFVVVVPATEHHPAQVVKVVKDMRVGKVTTTKQSSALTPGEKSDLLTRVDSLIQAAKKARARANNVEVEKVSMGDKIFNYIHKDLMS